MSALDFGFTNDQARIDAARAWRDAAIADGWMAEAMYAPREGIASACRLTRDGFVAQVITRENAPGLAHRFEVSVDVWGPDKLTVKPPFAYDWPAIQAAVRTCNACGATDVDTERYAFAGRCCAACLPAMRAKHERPGWNR